MENKSRDYSYFLAYQGHKSELITRSLNTALIHYSISKDLSDANHCIYTGEVYDICNNSLFLYGRVNNVQTTRVASKSFLHYLLFYSAFKLLRNNKVMDINTLVPLSTLIDYCDQEYINQIKDIVNEVGINDRGFIKGTAMSLRKKCLDITKKFIEKEGIILDVSKFLDMMFINGLSAEMHYKWIKLFNMERYERIKTNGKISVLGLYDGRLSKSYTYNDKALFGNTFNQERDALVSKIRNYIHNDLNECMANNHVHDSKLYKTVIKFLNSPHTKSEYYIPTIIAFNRLIKKVLKVDLSFDHLSSVNRTAKMKLQFILKFLSIDEITDGKPIKDKYKDSSLSLAKEHAIADMKLEQVLYDWFNL